MKARTLWLLPKKSGKATFFREENAILKTGLHFRAMIAWVEKQPQNVSSDIGYMQSEIGRNWSSEYCSLCSYNQDRFNGSGFFAKIWRMLHNKDFRCFYCPLAKKFGVCSLIYPARHYLNWTDWLKAARKTLKQIESLLHESQI